MKQVSAGYSAYVAHPSLGEEVVWGTVTFADWRLRFRSEAVSREMLLIKVVIEPEEGEGQGVCFYDPADPEWTIHTLDGEILSHPLLQQQPHTRHQIEAMQSRGELGRRLRLIGYVLGGFALAALLVSMLMGYMVKAVVARVPVTWEQEMGSKAMAELRQTETIVEDAKELTNVVAAVRPLLGTVPDPGVKYRFYLMEEELPNAFAVPGGHIVVTQGLLKLVERPEDIAGVIAHELAHVTQRHSLRQTVSSAGPYFLCRLFLRGNGGLMGVLAGSSQLLVCQSFSQEFEYEADDVGWGYLVAARIDPRGLAEMLRRLEEEVERLKLGDSVPQAFSSHPATAKRIRRLEEKWQKLRDKSGFIQYEKPHARRALPELAGETGAAVAEDEL